MVIARSIPTTAVLLLRVMCEVHAINCDPGQLDTKNVVDVVVVVVGHVVKSRCTDMGAISHSERE